MNFFQVYWQHLAVLPMIHEWVFPGLIVNDRALVRTTRTFVTEVTAERHSVRTWPAFLGFSYFWHDLATISPDTERKLPAPLHRSMNFPKDLLFQCQGLVDSSPGSTRILPGSCRSLFPLLRVWELHPFGCVINIPPVSNIRLRRAFC